MLSQPKEFINCDTFICLGGLSHNGSECFYHVAKEILTLVQSKAFFVVPGNHDNSELLKIHFNKNINQLFRINNFIFVNTKVDGFEHGHIDKNQILYIKYIASINVNKKIILYCDTDN